MSEISFLILLLFFLGITSTADRDLQTIEGAVHSTPDIYEHAHNWRISTGMCNFLLPYSTFLINLSSKLFNYSFHNFSVVIKYVIVEVVVVDSLISSGTWGMNKTSPSDSIRTQLFYFLTGFVNIRKYFVHCPTPNYF